jgi:coatomer subunit beta
VTARTVEEVLQVLKKEIAKTYDESETSEEYRRQLVKALHTCAVKFPEKAVSIVPILMEFIGDSNSASASVCRAVNELASRLGAN